MVRRKMKKGFLLIASIFLSLFLGIIISISLFRTNLQLKSIEARRASVYAFYAAEAGIERAIYELRKNINWRAGFNNESLIWEGITNQTIGYYDVQIANATPVGSLPTVWVRAQGRDVRYRSVGNQTMRRTILARVALQSPTAFFTSTIGDLNIVSGANIGGDVLARDIIFKVYKSFPPALRKIKINGTAFYIRDIQGDDEEDITIEGDKQKIPPITFVSVDLNRYKTLSQLNGRYIDGDFTYSGEINRKSLSAPNGLVFAENDVYISGEVTESMHIVAGRNIYITGDITCKNLAQIGLSAKEKVIIPESAPSTITIDAFIHMEGSIFKAEGKKYSKDTLNFEGAISVKGGGETAVDLSTYSTRNYTYDQQLNTNLSIPYMSYMADLLTWKEVSPSAPFPPH